MGTRHPIDDSVRPELRSSLAASVEQRKSDAVQHEQQFLPLASVCGLNNNINGQTVKLPEFPSTRPRLQTCSISRLHA